MYIYSLWVYNESSHKHRIAEGLQYLMYYSGWVFYNILALVQILDETVCISYRDN